jgi:Omp85 superfamily domain
MQWRMKFVWLGCLMLCGSLLSAGNQDSEFNVNSRYTVETVVLSTEDWSTNLVADQDRQGKLSSSLRKDVAALIGEKLNPTLLEEVGRRIRKEFRARTVEHHVLRGKTPEYVQVVFDIKMRPARFDVSIPKFLYNSKQSWTGAVEATASIRHHGLTFGGISDGDELAERYSGIVARYANNRVGSDRVQFRFQYENYHQRWNPETQRLASTSLYGTRQNFEPEVTFVLAKPLTLSVGASFQQMQDQFSAAPAEAANALISTLRYHRRLEGSESQHDLDAGYSLRAATKVLNSDFAYARHRVQVRYMLTRGKSVIIDELTGGMIAGRAPMFERFVLGNASTLRGWNKYELDPAGGNRVVHNSVEYRYGVLQVFYDTGAIWDRNDAAVVRHSAGIGLRQGVFSLAVAFPLREGRIEPIVMMGMNY